jgi:hypothetical protein
LQRGQLAPTRRRPPWPRRRLALRADRDSCAAAATILRPRARPAFTSHRGSQAPRGGSRPNRASGGEVLSLRVAALAPPGPPWPEMRDSDTCYGSIPLLGGGQRIRDRNTALSAGDLHFARMTKHGIAPRFLGGRPSRASSSLIRLIPRAEGKRGPVEQAQGGQSLAVGCLVRLSHLSKWECRAAFDGPPLGTASSALCSRRPF